MNILLTYLENLWDLYVDMSFYIVIGLLFTGALNVFVKKESVLRHVGKDNTASVVKASVVGVPLPLCSCGVVPTALYLGKSGASKGAVISFLTSTPQTGVDSLIATYGLMGPLFAVYRAVAAFFSGIIGGIATNIFCKNTKSSYEQPAGGCGCSAEPEPEVSGCGCSAEPEPEVSGCGCSAEPEPEVSGCGCSAEPEPEVSGCGCSVEPEPEVGGCGCCDAAPTSCCSGGDTKATKTGFTGKIKGIFRFAFGEFLDDIAVNFIVGLLIAALITTAVPQEWLATFNNPILTMLLMLVIGIPMYICSTASIPIALSLIIKGVSPGAAFVFLFAGPITNIASLAILAKTLGRKVMAVYIASACVCAIIFGLILDFIIELFGYTGIEKIIEESHEHEMPLYMVIVALVFAALLLKGLAKKLLPTAFFFKHRQQ